MYPHKKYFLRLRDGGGGGSDHFHICLCLSAGPAIWRHISQNMSEHLATTPPPLPWREIISNLELRGRAAVGVSDPLAAPLQPSPLIGRRPRLPTNQKTGWLPGHMLPKLSSLFSFGCYQFLRRASKDKT